MSEKVIKAYKGFDKNMQCRGFQYEIGKEYNIDGEIELCKQGFHACKSPIEVWSYYDMIGDGTRFAEVELSGKILENNSSTKVCASHIKIKNELSLTDMINLGVAYFKDITSLPKVKTNNLRVFKDVVEESNTGLTQLNIDEDISVISINDPNVMIMNNAFLVSINVNGNHNQICSTGDKARITSTGRDNKIVSTGNFVSILSSNVFNRIASTGKAANIVSTGSMTEIVSTGDNSTIITNGEHVCIDSDGKNNRIVCNGRDTKVKAKAGTLITLTEYDHGCINNVKTEYVDGVNIKENTWYGIKNGEFIETPPYPFRG